MDFLEGYGSSSDEEGKDPKQDETKAVSAAMLTAVSAASSSPKPKPVTAATRRGKKIISLSAVLPQHILDQLTKAQVEGASDDSDDDDDGDDNDDKVNRKPNQLPPAESASASASASSAINSKSSNSAKDKGLSLLLSDLQAAPTQGFIGSKQKKTANPQTQSESDTKSVASEKMGAAFLSSTTTTSTTSVGEPKQERVRDMHSHHSSSAETTNTRKAAPSLPRVPAPRPAAPVRRPVVSAAPPVAAKAAPASQPPPAAYPVQQHQQQSYPDTTNTNTNTNTNTLQSRKRSRKDLERALRQGNMDVVELDRDDGLTVQSLQQAQPDAYTPAEASYAQAPAHGVKVAPTAMYDPSAGQAVVGTSAAGSVKRGTNQINQLMASAANLEQQRTQGIGGAANQAGKTHRANAKHKYGW
jgi:hypothetical protein